MVASLVFGKLVLGVSLAAPIGSVSIEMIKRGLKGGFFAAFKIRLGGAIGNLLCLLGASFGLSFLLEQPLLYNTIGFLGAAFLIYMGVSSLVKKNLHFDVASISNDQQLLSNGIMVGLILSLANPIAVIFWLGVFAASMSASTQPITTIIGLSLNTFIIVGVLLWGVFLSLLLEGGKRVFSKKTARVVTIISSILLLFYGIKYGLITLGNIFF